MATDTVYIGTYKVYKVYRKSNRCEIIRTGLTLNEARTLVNSYPDSNRSMVVYGKEFYADKYFIHPSNKLHEISKERAEQLFNTGIVIYMQAEDINQAPESANTFMMNCNAIDASLNIYRGMISKPYNFDVIIKWVLERINNGLKYYTFYSTEFLIIENQ